MEYEFGDLPLDMQTSSLRMRVDQMRLTVGRIVTTSWGYRKLGL